MDEFCCLSKKKKTAFVSTVRSYIVEHVLLHALTAFAPFLFFITGHPWKAFNTTTSLTKLLATEELPVFLRPYSWVLLYK